MPHQPSPFLESIIRFLMPFFLGTAIDVDAARADIIETLGAYATRTRSELLTAAQIIAFSMTTLDVLSEAKTVEMSVAMRLRHRSCANGLNRACKQNEKTLDHRLAADPPTPAPTPAAKPSFVPEPANHPTDTHAGEVLQQVRAKIETAQPQPMTERNKHAWGAAMRDVLQQMGMSTDPSTSPTTSSPEPSPSPTT